jgi:hypothetical protein
LLAVVVLLAALVSLLHGGPAQAAPDDVGYRDFSYGTALAPTGEKPQSKLWYTPDGLWWGSLYDPERQRFEIHQFMRDTQSWTSTGVQVDERIDSQADALFETARGRLFIVSHLRDTARSAGDRSLRFLSYTYAGGSFVPDPGFPVTIAMVNPEAAVLDEDSTGTLWVTWTEPNGAGGRKVRVAHSTTDPGLLGFPGWPR